MKNSFSGTFSVKSSFYDYSFELPNSSIVEINLASSAAMKARDQVAQLTFDQRKEILQRAVANYHIDNDELDHLVKMTGMPKKYVRKRIEFGKKVLSSLPNIVAMRYGHKFGTITREVFRNGSSILRTTGYESHRPIDGLVAAFIPPNDPAEVSFLLGHIVMYGGTAIVKPSISEPYFSIKIAQLLTQAGYPKGALSVVHWDTRDESRNAVRSELIRRSSHRIIMGGKKTADLLLKEIDDQGRCVEEHYSTGKNCIFSSGHSKAIVTEGCDVEQVADLLVKGAYEWTLDCITTKTVFVVGDQKAELINSIKKRLDEKLMHLGDPLTEDCEIGYIENAERIVRTIQGVVDFKSATLHYGKLESVNKRCIPFLMETNQLHSTLLQQELPYTLTIVPVSHVDEAIAAVNQTSQMLDDGMTMAVSLFSPHPTLESFYASSPDTARKLLGMRCHLLMYNKPSTMLNMYLRHQDTMLTEFLTQPLSINHD